MDSRGKAGPERQNGGRRRRRRKGGKMIYLLLQEGVVLCTDRERGAKMLLCCVSPLSRKSRSELTIPSA